MTASVAEKFGRLDIAVNNAGVGVQQTRDECLPKSEWDRLMSVNLNGLWLCAQAEARQIINQRPTEGKIINIASITGVISLSISNGPYDASKAGVIHLTRQLAVQWGRFNINVNCISPSYVLTPMMAGTSVEFRSRVRELTPLGHMQRLEDLYGPVLYLASRASDYMTGQNLIIDGGHTLGPWLEPSRPRADARNDKTIIRRM
jgi:NAD(P)-dependent dehydrogenase (short-subunit alcohol dehydrogenase family)